MRAPKERTGERVGLLTVLGPAPRPEGEPGPHWLVRCECGTERVMSSTALGRPGPKTHLACARERRRLRGLE